MKAMLAAHSSGRESSRDNAFAWRELAPRARCERRTRPGRACFGGSQLRARRFPSRAKFRRARTPHACRATPPLTNAPPTSSRSPARRCVTSWTNKAAAAVAAADALRAGAVSRRKRLPLPRKAVMSKNHETMACRCRARDSALSMRLPRPRPRRASTRRNRPRSAPSCATIWCTTPRCCVKRSMRSKRG